MLKIEYTEIFFSKIDNYIFYLKNYYKKLYFDTGIVGEDIIISNYMQKTEELLFNILDVIEENLEKGVYGVIIEENKEYILSKLVIRVRSYNIVVIIRKYKNYFLVYDIIF